MKNFTENNNMLILTAGLLTTGFVVMCGCLLVVVVLMMNGDDSDNNPQPTPIVQQPTLPIISTATSQPSTSTPNPTATTQQAQPTRVNVNTPTGSYVTSSTLNVRSGPDTSFNIMTTLSGYQNVNLIGRNAAATWLQIRLANNTTGWVNAGYIYAAVSISNLPVITTPTPAPTLTTVPTAQTLTASPASGTAGTQVTVNAANFPANVRINIWLGIPGSQVSTTNYASGVTNASGSATLTFTMPANWVDGNPITYTQLIITAITDDFRYSASVPFAYTPVAPVIDPKITVQPTAGTQNTQIRVTGTGYPANTRVNIQFERDVMGILSEVYVSGNTDSRGNFDLSFIMPSAWSDGEKIPTSTLMLVASTENRTMATSPFSYTAPGE